MEKKVLNDFYAKFRNQLESAEKTDGGMRANTPTETDIPCPSCGRNMQIRVASTGGVFLGCSGYSLPPKERCKTTINLVSGDEVVSADDDVEGGEGETRLLRKKNAAVRNAAPPWTAT